MLRTVDKFPPSVSGSFTVIFHLLITQQLAKNMQLPYNFLSNIRGMKN